MREQFVSKCNQNETACLASQLQDSYGVEGVPSMGVAGKYYTDGTMFGSMQTVLQVVEYLAATARKNITIVLF